MRHFVGLLWHGLVVVATSALWVKAEVELIIPVEFEAGLGESIVPYLCAGKTFGEV